MKRTTFIESETGTSTPRVQQTENAVLPVPNDSGAKAVRTKLAAIAPKRPNREQLIIEAAYRHAEARSFEPGHELDDWLAAESEVDARLHGEGRAY